MKTTYIFDLDGTLVDSLQDLAMATNIVLKKLGFPTHPVSSYKKFVGDGVNMLIERALPSDKRDLVTEVRKQFDFIYDTHCLEATKPYPGIVKLIEKMKQKGLHLAIVTNKPDALAKKIVSELFGEVFLYVYGNQEIYPRKPDPYLVNKVIELYQVDKSEVVYIGDSDVDMYTGRNAGVTTVGVSWGFRGRDELLHSGGQYVVDNVKQLEEWIDDCSK